MANPFPGPPPADLTLWLSAQALLGLPDWPPPHRVYWDDDGWHWVRPGTPPRPILDLGPDAYSVRDARGPGAGASGTLPLLPAPEAPDGDP